MSRARLLLSVLLPLLLAGCPRAAAPEDRPAPSPLWALNLPSVGPAPYSLSGLRGKVVLVSFFATWCFPCLAELPVLEKMQKDNAAQGFTVVMVGLDLEGARVLEPWAEGYALPFPVLVGGDELRSGETGFGRIAALPTTFVFDREGKVLLAYQGVASPERLLEVVAKAVLQP